MRSMTGYGYGEKGNFYVIVKSLNHRFLEIEIKTKYPIDENEIRRMIRENVKRGKIEVIIDCESRLKLALSKMFKKNKSSIFEAFESALKSFIESKEREGEEIKKDIKEKISYLTYILDEIKKLHEDFPKKIKKHLKEKIEEIREEANLPEIPDGIIDTAGVVHLVRKADISEEISRIEFHISSFIDELEKEADGKKLLFISQEILREINTLTTKSIDVSIISLGIQAKLEIEKIREQLYNVE